MKQITERIHAIQTHDNQGKVIEVKGTKKVIIHTVSGRLVWANAEQVDKTANQVNYKLNEKGDTFVATRDSNTLDKDGNPVYLKGQNVTRNAESVEFLSATVAEEFTTAMKEKMEFAAKLGLAVKI